MELLNEFEYIFRIFIAGICGGLIGFERKNRGKEAGLRTHMIVAMAAALMMVISKYGFADQTINEFGVRGADSARIAAQVVSGVGFLGAGMIFVHKNSIKGLTTAAGIWATSGIGMAVGAGMYIIGIFSTILMIITQIIMHKNWKFIKNFVEDHIIMIVKNEENVVDTITKYFNDNGAKIESIEVKELKNGEILSIDLDVNLRHEFNATDLIAILPKDSVKYIKG